MSELKSAMARVDAIGGAGESFAPKVRLIDANEMLQAAEAAHRAEIASAAETIFDGPNVELIDAIEAAEAEMKKAAAEGYTMSMAEAAMIVLTPVLRADANKQRQTVIAELKGRPAAANGQVVGAQKGDVENAGPRSVEDAIKESIQQFRSGRATA